MARHFATICVTPPRVRFNTVVPGDDPTRRALVTGGTGRIGSVLVARLRAEHWALVAAAVSELGGLDLVVHAAADGWRVQPIEDVSEDDWDRAFGATAKGAFFVGQAALPHLRASRGLLVLIEDVAGELPWVNLAPHAAAKSAQHLLTNIFARALAPDARACGIAPGPVAVDEEHAPGRAQRTLLGRVGSPDDIADALMYLVGAGYVTGTTLVVDGGRRLKTIAPED
jgi:pteridine reductase